MSRPSSDYAKLIKMFKKVHRTTEHDFWDSVYEDEFTIIGADLQKMGFIFDEDGTLIDWE